MQINPLETLFPRQNDDPVYDPGDGDDEDGDGSQWGIWTVLMLWVVVVLILALKPSVSVVSSNINHTARLISYFIVPLTSYSAEKKNEVLWSARRFLLPYLHRRNRGIRNPYSRLLPIDASQPPLPSTSTSLSSASSSATLAFSSLPSSDGFDSSANFGAGENRKGFAEAGDEVVRVMEELGIGFDEARTVVVERMLEAQGIDPKTGVPKDARDLTPLSPLSYFESSTTLALKTYSFRVFHSGIPIPAIPIPAPAPTVPGPSPLNQSPPPVYILHHGGGYSAASFGMVAKKLREIDASCAVVAWDCRGHGESGAVDGEAASAEGLGTTNNVEEMSLARLSADTRELISAMQLDTCGRDMVFVGHSLGGAVVVDAVKEGGWKNVLGVVVVDVVEGGLTSHTLRTPEAARLAMPPLVIRVPAGDERGDRGGPAYKWRTDLAASEEWWEGWFENLSEKFLSVRAAKFLILAGTDRLDTPLMIGQMQGKFQLTVIPDSGHLVPLDQPTRLAQELASFSKRNRRIVLPPRFGLGAKVAAGRVERAVERETGDGGQIMKLGPAEPLHFSSTN
ncbi:Protein phosphatase methylesterase 1 [Gonapodya sp. JEL0774]|nr:Protein phosphatase methylesterase 1 [Gonapodya sp. JEL0774]